MQDFKKILNDFHHFIRYVQPLSENSVKAYINDVNQYLEFLIEEEIAHLDEVSYDLILVFLTHNQGHHSNATVNRKITALRRFHLYCLKFSHSQINPTTYLSARRKGSKLPKFLSEKTIRKLLSFEKVDAKDYLDYAILLVLFRGGLRVSECVDLQFSQIYQDEKLLRVIGKGNKERMIPIAKDALDALVYYIDKVRPTLIKRNLNYVFISKTGKKITRQYVHEMIQLRREEMGIDQAISAHTLRHSLATSMLDNEVDLRVIQEMLGHSDISTTQVYTHVKTNTIRNEYDQYLKGEFHLVSEKEEDNE